MKGRNKVTKFLQNKDPLKFLNWKKRIMNKRIRTFKKAVKLIKDKLRKEKGVNNILDNSKNFHANFKC